MASRNLAAVKRYNAKPENQVKRRKYRRKYYNTPEGKLIRHHYHLKGRYGKTLDDKNALYVEQKGLCALCGKPLPDYIPKAFWDHDHKTGKMRGLVHQRCSNLVIAWIESEEYQTSVAAYLRKYV